ncbi:hypothetical protein [Qipengyuania aquimaris]|uniref:Sugar transporter n=1 Tax=Qipengyuania aquimaris TaxID=255984 RepID=A0A9Q3XDE3_9SPHN|nr:hypothetical protein [Qipengyuania aquimaris]MBY6218424.1 hypothetical protein [Qipengyuania aquimaris]
MSADGANTPWHLWLIGALGVLWNGLGCYIYTMAMTRDPETLASAPPEMVAALEAAPAWSNGAWAFGVWGGLAGSLLLLARSRFAVPVFVVSLLGLVGTTYYEITWDVPVDEVQRLTIWGAALFLLFYSWSMRKRGVLG